MRCSILLLLSIVACHEERALPETEQPTIADRAWLTQSLWNDGKSEIAFYDGWIHAEKDDKKTFSLATQLTKQSFDRAAQTKSDDGISSFKWTLFFEVVSGSEQFKHSYVANLAQLDLSPLKISANRFDWCSNQYRELAFLSPREVHVLHRSDDYGNFEKVVDLRKLTYPATTVPLLVRAADFSKLKQIDFSLILLDGTYVSAMMETLGVENDAEKIAVHYAHPIESIVGPSTSKEIYRRALDPARTLLELEHPDGRYGLKLVETIRSAYWEENVFDRLQQVKLHP